MNKMWVIQNWYYKYIEWIENMRLLNETLLSLNTDRILSASVSWEYAGLERPEKLYQLERDVKLL